MSQNKPIKPLCLRKKEALDELTESINRISEKYGLSYSILDDIMFRIQVNIAEGCSREMIEAQRSYNELLCELEKNKNETEEVAEDG